MHAQVELHLALILFLPWFAILGVLFWMLPRAPRTTARRVYDIAALVLATAAFLASVYWAQAAADPAFGRIWRQVLPTAVGYGVFLAAMLVAVLLRAWLIRTGRLRNPAH